MTVLETERLVLRPFRMDDLEDFHIYAKNPRVGPNAGWRAHESISESRDILKGFVKAEDLWAIVRRDEDRVMGSVGLHRDRIRPLPKVRMLGYVLEEAFWGHGYATESALEVLRYAFVDKGLSMVSIYHYAHNDRSRRVVEKCGFQCDGALTDAAFHPDGFIADDVCYSLTRREYLSKVEIAQQIEKRVDAGRKSHGTGDASCPPRHNPQQQG